MIKIKILIATHVEANFPETDIFMPIHAGKAVAEKDLGIPGDDLGDNISKENPHYSEMTAHYWAWKNLKNIDYVGLCHYRRYFDIVSIDDVSQARIRLSAKNFILKILGRLMILFKPYKNLSIKWIRYIHANEIKAYGDQIKPKLLNEIRRHNYDIFYMKPFFSFNRTVNESFLIGGYYYYEQLGEIIANNFEEYKPFYDEVMSGHLISTNNMHLMKWNVYDEYCSFLFEVLEKHRALNRNEGNSYLRVVAYMAEILTTVFLFRKKKDGSLKMKTMSHIYVKEYFAERKSPLG